MDLVIKEYRKGHWLNEVNMQRKHWNHPNVTRMAKKRKGRFPEVERDNLG